MRSSFLALALGGALVGLAGCKKDADLTSCPNSLVGTWRLTHRQCYCVPEPTPDEQVTFDGSGNFTFYRDGQAFSSGTYTTSTFGSNAPCNANQPAVNFTFASSNPPSHTPSASYALANCTLMLDFGSCLDAPRDTYERQ